MNLEITRKFFMKKLWILTLSALTSLTCFPAFSDSEGARPVDQIPSDPFSDMTTDEYVFAAQLNDTNKQAFVHMTSEQRAECMHMTALFNTTGNTLSPDAAVEKVVATMQNKD
jgi:hypothetical protein